MLLLDGSLQRAESLVAIRQHEIAILLQIEAARIFELLGGRLEEADALLAEPDIELQPPLHAEPGAVASRSAAGEFAFIEDQYARTAARLRHPPGAGQSIGAGAHDQNVDTRARHGAPAFFWLASAAKETGRIIGRGVIISREVLPVCSAVSAATEWRHIRPAHQPIPERTLRFTALSVRWPSAKAPLISPSFTFSQRHTIVSSVTSRQVDSGTCSMARTARWKF